MLYNAWEGDETLQHKPYRPFNPKHPMSIFIASCKAAYLFVLRLARRLFEVYALRYGREHKCYARVVELSRRPVPAHIPDVQADEFPDKVNLFTRVADFDPKKQVLLATVHIPGGCKWFPLCLTDVDSVRTYNGRLSGVLSYRAYYRYKHRSPTFKKNTHRKRQPYNFKRLFRKYKCC